MLLLKDEGINTIVVLKEWIYDFLQYSIQVTLILRGANDFMLDEMDRALHDALCIVKRTLESNTVSTYITEDSAWFLIWLRPSAISLYVVGQYTK